MAPTIRVTVHTEGEARLARAGRALRDCGDKDIQRQLRKRMSRDTKPYRDAARHGALQILPHRGGLDEHVAATARISTRTTFTANGVRVRIYGTSRDNLRRMDEEGIVRHPTFGHPPWKDEKIRAGWFTDPLTITANDEGRKAVEQAVEDAARQLEANL